jgi:hypothetical protein
MENGSTYAPISVAGPGKRVRTDYVQLGGSFGSPLFLSLMCVCGFARSRLYLLIYLFIQK